MSLPMPYASRNKTFALSGWYLGLLNMILAPQINEETDQPWCDSEKLPWDFISQQPEHPNKN